MADNLARELSYCIAELYEGLDEMRAEMAALKAALKAGPGGANDRLVRAEPMPDHLPVPWSAGPERDRPPGRTQNPECRRKEACSERDGDSIYGQGGDTGDQPAGRG